MGSFKTFWDKSHVLNFVAQRSPWTQQHSEYCPSAVINFFQHSYSASKRFWKPLFVTSYNTIFKAT